MDAWDAQGNKIWDHVTQSGSYRDTALDGGNVETKRIHICPEQMLDKPLTICLMKPILRTNVLFVQDKI